MGTHLDVLLRILSRASVVRNLEIIQGCILTRPLMRSGIERHFSTEMSNHDQTNGKDQSHEPVTVPRLSHYSSTKSRLCLPGTITIIGSIKIYRCNPTLATSTSDNGMQSEALGSWRDAANGPGSSLKREIAMWR
jgi:hypothetical protein